MRTRGTVAPQETEILRKVKAQAYPETFFPRIVESLILLFTPVKDCLSLDMAFSLIPRKQPSRMAMDSLYECGAEMWRVDILGIKIGSITLLVSCKIFSWLLDNSLVVTIEPWMQERVLYDIPKWLLCGYY